MEINDVTLKKPEFPANLEVFTRNVELLDFTVTVLGRPPSSSEVTLTLSSSMPAG